MGIKKATSRKASVQRPATAAPRAAAKEVAPRRTAGKPNTMNDKQKREKLLKERFCPEGISWLKDVLGIDVASARVPLQALYDISGGNVTSDVLEAIVKPMAYDKDRKENVEMPPIKVVGSFRIIMPYDRKTFVPIPPTAENPVFVASYPCYDMMDRIEPSEAVALRSGKTAAEDGEMPKFTPQMVMALEGVGIREDRLFANSFNAISLADKRAMVSGEAFECTGTVRVADGLENRILINVNGLAKLTMGKDGDVTARFQPQYPAEHRPGQVIDLVRASRVGNVELDIYERDSRGYRKTDVYGNPIINKAGKDLVKYGRAFGFMDGYVHTNQYVDGKFEDNVSKVKYEVSVVNGGLCPTKANKVLELDENGKQVMIMIGGKETEKFHYESKYAKVGKDGTVRVGTQDLKPATPADLQDYKRGVGGKFVGFETKDMKTGKKIVYDAYVVPDNRRNGYGRAYSQKASEELISRREEKKAARKQNYSMGL